MSIRAQCKDISDLQVLKFLKRKQGSRCNWFEIDGGWDNPDSVRHAFPKGCPGKLVLAKMRMMMRRGLVAGCPCGCRGDFEITPKGLDYINALIPQAG